MQAPRLSIRLKLTIGSLLPLFVAILFCSMIGIYLINSRINSLAQEKVRTDLNSAREVYNNEIKHIREVVRFTAGMPIAAKAAHSLDRKAVAPFLSNLRQNEQLDILTLVDKQGRVVFRAANPEYFGDNRSNDYLVSRALQGNIAAGTELFTPERVALEGDKLVHRAAIDIIPTERGMPQAMATERTGMLLVAAAPVTTSQGEIVGALYGGVLLNGNNSVVDRIKKIVFEGVQFKGQDVGTATIFLDGTRISTNVHGKNEKRAIGTRLSAEVYDRVIINKEKWVDRAFVVNDWYFSAYEPIFDLRGTVIGSLYVGMREEPQLALKEEVGLLFAGILLAGLLFGLAVSGYIGGLLAHPIRELKEMVQRFSAGERELLIKINSKDEIGELAQAFSDMTRTIMAGEAEIRELNHNLELKVQERTEELEAQSALLIKTQEELLRAEKLAAVGELAAGVAHEINNPMAIIRGNTEVLLMELQPGHPNREEAEIISQQVGRVAGIVGNLLSFARHRRKIMGVVVLEGMLEEILRQVRHHVSLDLIEVRKEFNTGASEIEGDENQLRQVFTNLIVNAVQAMDKGGVLTIRTALDATDNSCRIEVEDTGNGIAPEQINDVFTPFFTTKQSGTGLGLSVSYGIIKNHGGKITVTSEQGKGSTFVVILPQSQKKSHPKG